MTFRYYLPLLILLMSLSRSSFAQHAFPVPEPKRIKGDLDSHNIRVFLNGQGINSVRNQTLENVNVRIAEDGNIYISAPQYEVNVEKNYRPLIPQEIPTYNKEKPTPEFLQSKEGSKSDSEQSTQVATTIAPTAAAPSNVDGTNIQNLEKVATPTN